MSALFHCPYRQSTLLQQALASDKMRIAFLLGAGCPVSIRIPNGNSADPLIPDIRGLTTLVNQRLAASVDHSESHDAILKRFADAGLAGIPTIEDILTHIRTLQDVVRSGLIDGIDKAMLIALDAEICKITTEIVGVSLPAGETPYHQLAMWVGGIQRKHPIEVFTPNYDLLIEQALEFYTIPYFDGFVGSKQAFFDLTSMESKAFPSHWARLWKVHGSINWWRKADGTAGSTSEVVRTSVNREGATDRQMIYPSHLKYDQSRRLPYLAMLDRLREFLASGQGVLVTSGYSFADQHINEVILHGLRSNPTAICFGLLYGPRSGYADAVEWARKYPNLSLLAKDGAILGASDRDWRIDPQDTHPLHGICVQAQNTAAASGDPPKPCEFLLGDFKHLGEFLARQLALPSGETGIADAP